MRKQAAACIYRGEQAATPSNTQPVFDYGSLERLPVYRGTSPAVMRERIAAMDWKHLLQYSGPSRVRHRHDRFRYRLLTFIEQNIFRGSGYEFWGYKPYRVLRGISRRYVRWRREAPISPAVPSVNDTSRRRRAGDSPVKIDITSGE